MESSNEEMIIGNCGVGISLEYYDGYYDGILCCSHSWFWLL